MNEESLDSKLHNLLTKQLNTKNIFNAVLAIQSGDETIDWVGAVGYNDHEKKAEMRAESPYFIASITKMYIAAVVMHLHERNLLNLEDRILKYLPASLISGIHIHKGINCVNALKIVHLLSQTSGLADYFEDKQRNGESVLDKITKFGDYEFNVEDVMSIVREELNPKFQPGVDKKAYYSDTNFQLLGAIIESVAGKSLQDVCNETIFTPLELENTYLFKYSLRETKSQPAQMYYGNQPMTIPKAMSSFGPDGGIVSNGRESITFIRAFFDGVLFPERYLKEMKQWRKIFFPLEYGYGLMRFKLPRFLSPFKPFPSLSAILDKKAAYLKSAYAAFLHFFEGIEITYCYPS